MNTLRRTTSLRSWLRRLLISETPLKRTPRRRLGLELLEDRTVPAQVDVGPLRFLGDTLQPFTETAWMAAGGVVSIGYAPTEGEAFLALVNVDLTHAEGNSGTLTLDPAQAPLKFTIQDGTIHSVVQGSSTPIWQTPDKTTAVNFDIQQLVSANGLALTAGQPFVARSVNVALTNLGFANPDGGSTTDAQVLMQGTVSFPQLETALFDLRTFQARIDGGNYLIADSNGLTLTGLTFAATDPVSYTVFGLDLQMAPGSITYSSAGGQDTFAISAGVSVSSQPQDASGQRAVHGLGARLDLTVTTHSVQRFGFDVVGGFTVFGLEVATDASNPLTFDFDFQDQRYEIRGGLALTIPTATPSTVAVNLGYTNNPNDPGILFVDGALTQLNATINGTIHLAGAEITTSNNGLNFSYNRDQEQFEMYGSLTLLVPTAEGFTTSLTAQMGDANNPGLVIQNNELQQLNLSLSGQFDVYGLTLVVTDAGLMYDRSKDLYEISGTVSVGSLWNATVQLGVGSQPGIVIQNGRFKLDDLILRVANVNLAVFTVQNLAVSYTTNPTTGDYTVDVKGEVVFPAGWAVGGELKLVDGKLDSIDLFFLVTSGDGIAVGDTGLFLTYIDASVQNIDNPHNLIVSGKIGFNYGSTVSILGRDATIFRAEGDFTVDRNELILSGDIYVGAYQTGTDPNGIPTYGGLLGHDSVNLTLDWGDKYYSLELSITLYNVFQVTGIIAFDDGGDFLLAARAAVKIPDGVPFVGGRELGDIDFLFEYHHDDTDRSFLAAWTEFTIPIIDKHIHIGFQYNLGGHLSFLGGSQIDAYDGCFNHPEQCLDDHGNYTYYSAFSSPAGATGVTLTVDWPEATGSQTVSLTLPDGTVLKQDQFNVSTNGAVVVPQLSSSRQTGVHVVGSAANVYIPLTQGSYTLTLTSTAKFDVSDVSFTAMFHYPVPTITTPELSSNPAPGDSPGVVPVTLSGNVDEGFKNNTRVTLYVDNDGAGYDGVPVRGATNLPVTTDGQGNWTALVGWNLSGLLPTEYYVYAVVNDGSNTPVFSAYSSPRLANPPMYGTVTDVGDGRHDALAGLLVYLDLNHNGQYDQGEPQSITNSEGFFEFWDLQANTPYAVTVVIPTGFTAGSTNPQTVTWDGQDPAVVPIELLKRAAINGTVYSDLNQNGIPDPGEGLANWTVFADTNGNGLLDAGEVVANTIGDGTYSLLDLVPNTTYAVTLQLQSGYYQTTPVGGYSITLNSDPYQQIKQQNFGVLPFSTISGNVAEYALNNGSLAPSTTPLEGWTVRLLAPVVSINAGGNSSGAYEGDRDFTGGQTFDNTNTIDTRGVVSQAPEYVYQTFRFDPTFGYTVTGLTPGTLYAVRLHFVEHYYTSSGQRVMDVTANGQPMLVGFDIFAASGATNRAVAVTVTAEADTNGTLTFQFTGRDNEALVNAIEVFSQTAVTTTDANGNYTFGNLRAGEYTVLQEVQDSWRQVSPFTPELQLQTPTGNDYQFNFATPTAVVTAKFTGRTAGIALIDTGLYVFSDANIASAGQYFQPTDDSNAIALATGDYYGTGWQDVAALWQGNGTARIDLLQNNGSANFSQQIEVWTLPGTVYGFVTARLLNGGNADQLAVLYRLTQNQEFAIATLYFDSNGTPQMIEKALSLSHFPGTMVAGDIDDDGLDELLIGFANGSPILVSPLADGSPVVQTLNTLPAGAQVVLGDINGDGLLDAGVFDGGALFHYALQDQAGNFNSVYASGVGKPGHPVAAAFLRDVDGDLRPDLVWVSEGVGVQAVFVAQNTLTTGAWFTPARQTVWSLAATPGGGLDLALGDFDGDGLADLVVTQAAEGTVEIVRNRSVINPTAILVSVVGSNSTGNNFVNAPPGQIYGRVYEDVTRDGNHLLSKPGRAGVTVFVDLNGNGRLDPGEPTSRTGSQGLFAFDGLADGVYRVGVVSEPGRRWTSPQGEFVEFTVHAGQSVANDVYFGSAAALLLPVADQAVTVGQELVVVVPRNAEAIARRVVFSLEPGAPVGAALDPDSGRFTWSVPANQAPGEYAVTVRVRDPLEPAQSETIRFSITVRPVPGVVPSLPLEPVAAPIEAPMLARTVRHGSGMTLVFSATTRLLPGALRLFVVREGRPVADLTSRLRVRRVVRNGRTFVTVWFVPTPEDEEMLSAGRLSLWVRNRLVRDARTAVSLASGSGDVWTKLRY